MTMIGEPAKPGPAPPGAKTGSKARCADACPAHLSRDCRPRWLVLEGEPTSVDGSRTCSPGTSTAEQVRHHVSVVIAGMIEAGELEPRLERTQQREMSIEVGAFDAAVVAVIGVDDHHDLVDVGCKAVVVLVPHDDDRAAIVVAPRRRRMDRLNDALDGHVTLVDEGRVQSCLRTVGLGIEVAERAGVAATMLIVALVRHDEKEIRHVAGCEVGIEALGTIEPDHVLEAALWMAAFLHALEVDERVVLGSVELDDIALRQRRI